MALMVSTEPPLTFFAAMPHPGPQPLPFARSHLWRGETEAQSGPGGMGNATAPSQVCLTWQSPGLRMPLFSSSFPPPTPTPAEEAGEPSVYVAGRGGPAREGSWE